MDACPTVGKSRSEPRIVATILVWAIINTNVFILLMREKLTQQQYVILAWWLGDAVGRPYQRMSFRSVASIDPALHSYLLALEDLSTHSTSTQY
jgi:hypothetical protein